MVVVGGTLTEKTEAGYYNTCYVSDSGSGQGCHRLSEIAGRLQRPTTSLTRPLQRLRELKLVRKEQPFGAHERSSKRSLHLLDDPFLAFWFRYVEPTRSRLALGLIERVAAEMQKDFNRYCGTIWGQLARDWVPRMKSSGLEWGPARRWWGKGKDGSQLEVDIVAESKDSKSLLVGEATLAMDVRAFDRALVELNEKISRLPFAGEYTIHYPMLFIARKPTVRVPSRYRNKVVYGDAVLLK